MFGKPGNQSAVILFGRIKICVDKRPPIVVAPLVDDLRIFAAPALDPALLFAVRGPSVSVTRHNSGFKMIGKGEDEMNFSVRKPAREPLPAVRGEHPQPVSEFLADFPTFVGQAPRDECSRALRIAIS